MKVERLLRRLKLTPEAAHEGHWAINLQCTCGASREFMNLKALRHRWTDDLADIFAQTHFRCQCGGEATVMRIVQTGPASVETLMTATKKPRRLPDGGATAKAMKLRVRDH